jgi:hypothetical protein
MSRPVLFHWIFGQISLRTTKLRNAAAMPHNSAKASAAPTTSFALAGIVCGSLHGANNLNAAATMPIAAP